MEVAEDEVAVVQLVVDRGIGNQDAGQPADEELRDERQCEQHRGPDAADLERGQRGREVLLQVRAQLVGQLPAVPHRILLSPRQHRDHLDQLGVCGQRPVRVRVSAQDVRQRHRVGVI
jgi:hypothetical protein